MAVIKCRYTYPVCELDGKRQYFNEFWYCDCNDECAKGRYTRPDDADEYFVNPPCKFHGYSHGEFEKSVKNYEYSDGDLKIGRTIYHDIEIDYLEIDGRILRGDEDE